MPPPLSVSTEHAGAPPPRITATHASGGGRGRGGHRGRRGARGGNGNSATASPSESSGSDAVPSLLSRLGPRVGESTNMGSNPSVPSVTMGSESPTTPKAEVKPNAAFSIKGASLPPRPPNAVNGRRPPAKKSTLTVGTSSDSPPKAETSNPSKIIPGSAPPERTAFVSVESERPASALAVSGTKEASIRGVSPTPRLSWADETDDDSLPDLDDWMTPTLEVTDGKDAVPAGEDEERTPVASAPPAGPLRERRKRGAGKKNKQLAAKAAENAAAAKEESASEALPVTGSSNASSLEDSVAKLSLSSTKGKEKEPEATTPKADWRSVLPDKGKDGAMQLLTALAGSIATTQPTYRTPSLQPHEPSQVQVADPAPPSEPKAMRLPAPIPTGPAANRNRAVPSPIPTPAGSDGRVGPPVFNGRPVARSPLNGMHHATMNRGPFRADIQDTPVTLPKKHVRPVITADAITRLARGLVPAAPKSNNGVANGSSVDSREEGRSTSE